MHISFEGPEECVNLLRVRDVRMYRMTVVVEASTLIIIFILGRVNLKSDQQTSA